MKNNHAFGKIALTNSYRLDAKEIRAPDFMSSSQKWEKGTSERVATRIAKRSTFMFAKNSCYFYLGPKTPPAVVQPEDTHNNYRAFPSRSLTRPQRRLIRRQSMPVDAALDIEKAVSSAPTTSRTASRKKQQELYETAWKPEGWDLEGRRKKRQMSRSSMSARYPLNERKMSFNESVEDPLLSPWAFEKEDYFL